MKKLLLLITLISSISTNSFCQLDSSNAGSQNEFLHNAYLEKARRQKTTGFVFLGSGAALVVTGILIGDAKNADLGDALTGVVTGGIGAIAVIVSIPFFVSSAVNKHNANIKFDSQKTALGIPGKVSKSVTGITLSIPLGK